MVSSCLSGRDYWGTFRVRLGSCRMTYTVEPGLYAINSPDDESPVLVTANYKLSFDHLRRCLPGAAAWILVLDTRGINVWCAAGKGTFGTAELVARLKAINLARLVNHRRIILPQLAAPGVAAHTVRAQSGFRVVYGPVAARDLPRFLANGLKATPAMRRKTFTFTERAVLIPVELVVAGKWALLLAPFLYLLSGYTGTGSFWANANLHGGRAVMGLWGGIAAGAILTPLLLPLLPGRAFALKGIWPGLLVALLSVLFGKWPAGESEQPLETWAWLLLVPALSSFLAMEFTGASTYTSLSGVKKEMRLAVPLQAGAGIAGLALLLWARFSGG